MIVLTIILDLTGALNGMERAGYDARIALRGTQTPPPGIVLVKVDQETFNQIDRPWPFPRSLHAGLIDRLKAAGAKVIAYDIQFSEQTVPDEDSALLEAIRRAGNVVLATDAIDENGAPDVLGGGPIIRIVRARVGAASLRPERAGVERRLPYETLNLKSFAIVAAERATGRTIKRTDLGRRDSALIDYAGPEGTIPAFSFWQVLQDRMPASVFRDKIVVVGATAPSLHDQHVTPTTGGGLMSGPELQANAIATALTGFPLRPPWPPAVDLLIVLLLGLVIPLAGTRLLVGWAVFAGLVAAAGYLVIAQVAFNHDHVLPVAAPMVAVALNVIGAVVAYSLSTAFERDRTRETFIRFVPESVLDEVLRASDGVRLGGVERICTVMFLDIRGFTSYSESREAPEVIEVLNRFLSDATDAVLDNGGTLLTFLGDGMMALFGAPLVQPDHADRGVRTSRDVLRRLNSFNEWLVAEGHGEPFRIGIGLHTGPVVCGNVGSVRRLAYTAIGDAANTAARVEQLTKETAPWQILISDTTRRTLTRDPGRLVHLGEWDIRGRQQALTLWAVDEAG